MKILFCGNQLITDRCDGVPLSGTTLTTTLLTFDLNLPPEVPSQRELVSLQVTKYFKLASRNVVSFLFSQHRSIEGYALFLMPLANARSSQ